MTTRPAARLRLALLVADGPGVRNFVLGSFLREASRGADVHVLHPIPEELLDRYRAHGETDVQWTALPPSRDTIRSFTLRNTLAYAHLYWGNTGAMKYNRRAPIRGSLKTRSAIRFARAAGRVAARPPAMRTLERWHTDTVGRSPESAYFRRVFTESRPRVLFCSNQRAPIAVAAVAAARALGIVTATFIFSWDNITSKGRIVAPFDHYLVWSAHMRDELLQFYPNISPHQVHVVGTPQFDPYADPAVALPRGDFLRSIGADSTRPLIGYSGGDPTVYTAEHEYVRLLMRLVREQRIHRSPQVVLRPSPADDGRQYDAVRRDFPELLYAPPAWIHTRPGEWSRTLPLAQDVAMLANLTRHADVNINLNSTMTLDHALQDRPVVNIAFDVLSPPPFGQPLWDFFYQFDHYHPVINFGAARFPRTPEQLAQAINAYLSNPALDRAGRRQFAQLEVGVPIGRSSATVLSVLRTLAGQPITSDSDAGVAAAASS